MKRNNPFKLVLVSAMLILTGLWQGDALAATPGLAPEPVELNGDTIEYKADEGKFVASGHVYLKQNNAVLFCDELEFFRDKKEAHARGNVTLDSDKGQIWADKVFYNFETQKGEFTNARLMADPFYGRAASIIKVRQDYYIVRNGYLTTSDHDDPGYRIKARIMEVYPGDRAVARDAVMLLGKVPVVYLPRYVQDLRDNRPHISVIPGYKKDFGAFLLTSYRAPLTERIETVYHFDVRELKGAAGGVDAKYNADPFGKGLVRTYYMNERTTNAHRAWDKNTIPDEEHQRYRVEWRHMWNIDPSTMLIGQYYKQTDPDFLKTYFPREFREDEAPETYALLTHTTPKTTSSLRMDVRANRYESTLERLPEAAFNLSSSEIGDTGFYFKSNNTVTNLVKNNPSPSEDQERTLRMDSDDELSRPFKFSIFELRPYTGTQATYYTHTLDARDNDTVRRIFKVGSDVSTKFYRIYDLQYNRYGIEINRLRHVITPTMGYLFQHEPTLTSDKLFQYDSVDAREQIDKFSLGLENKLQTKRNGQSVDLARALLTTDFRLKDNPSSGSFGDVVLDTEVVPNKYLSLFSDLTYDNDHNNLRSANVDAYINSHKNWAFDVSRRFERDDDDIVTSQWEYKFNPIWRTAIYQRWNVENGKSQEQQYALVRDLHSWEVEFAFKNRKGYDDGGAEVWVIFRLKAFPSVGTGTDTAFSHINRGSQGLGQ